MCNQFTVYQSQRHLRSYESGEGPLPTDLRYRALGCRHDDGFYGSLSCRHLFVGLLHHQIIPVVN